MEKSVKRKIRCINCPEGCILDVEYRKPDCEITIVKGNKCKRGVKFAQEEIKNPTRIITTTISIDSGSHRRLPVRSNIPVPKSDIFKILDEIKKIRVKPPVRMGDMLIRDILKTGAGIVSSITVED